MSKMNVDLPPIDPVTFWGTIMTIIGAPFAWFHRRLKKLEDEYVTKEEFKETISDLKATNHENIIHVREDIREVKESLKAILQHLMNRP